MNSLINTVMYILSNYWFVIIFAVIFFSKTLLCIVINFVSRLLTISTVGIRKTGENVDDSTAKDLDDKFMLWTYRLILIMICTGLVFGHKAYEDSLKSDKAVAIQQDQEAKNTTAISDTKSDKMVRVDLKSVTTSVSNITVGGVVTCPGDKNMPSKIEIKIGVYDDKDNLLYYMSGVAETSNLEDKNQLEFKATRDNPSGDKNIKYTYKVDSITEH